MKNKIVPGIIAIVLVIVLAYIVINNKKPMDATTNTTTTSEQEIVPGLTSKITQEGTGDRAVVAGDSITVNYTGRLTDGTSFDSSVDPAFGHTEPLALQIGVGQVIIGWDKGVIGMKVGEKRTLTIAPELGYGDRAVGDKIPANSTLVFDIELVSIK